MIIASSHVSSFGGSASSMLINIGADVAFVGTTKGESVRVSARAKRDAVNAGVNLGQLMVDRNRQADAVQYFQAALQMNPGMTQAQAALAKLPGAQVAAAGPSAPAIAAPQQASAPAGPSFGPQQQTWPAGPQFGYPATARQPAVGSSSYVPPQYLPPIASQPGGPLQR